MLNNDLLQEIISAPDFCLLNPPFGVGVDRKRLETRSLEMAIDRLPINGQCVAIMPDGFLGRSGQDQLLRKRLVKECDLQEIILLPLHVFAESAQVYTCLLSFQKSSGGGITKIYDLRDASSPQLQKRSPILTLSRQDIREHKYSLLINDYQEPEDYDETRESVLLQAWEGCLQSEITQEQLSMFSASQETKNINQRIKYLKKMYRCGCDLLAERLKTYCNKNQFDMIQGGTLFQINSGKKAEKEVNASNLIYGSAGVSGLTFTSSKQESLQWLVVGRTGSNCGNVYRPWQNGVVSSNAMQVIPIAKDIELEILRLQLHSANLGQSRRGTGQPYITNDVPLSKYYCVPDKSSQEQFLQSNITLLRDIQKCEQELQKLEANKYAGTHLRSR